MSSVRQSCRRTFLLALAAVAVSGAPALAQSGSDTPSGPQMQVRPPSETKPVSFTDDELRAFAKAALEVRRLRGEFMPRLEAAESPEMREKIGRQASEAFNDAIEQEGLSPHQYDSIFAAAQSDESVAARVNRYLGEVR